MFKSIYISTLLSMVPSQEELDPDLSVAADDSTAKTVIEYENCRVNLCAHGDDNILLAFINSTVYTYVIQHIVL